MLPRALNLKGRDATVTAKREEATVQVFDDSSSGGAPSAVNFCGLIDRTLGLGSGADGSCAGEGMALWRCASVWTSHKRRLTQPLLPST